MKQPMILEQKQTNGSWLPMTQKRTEKQAKVYAALMAGRTGKAWRVRDARQYGAVIFTMGA